MQGRRDCLNKHVSALHTWAHAWAQGLPKQLAQTHHLPSLPGARARTHTHKYIQTHTHTHTQKYVYVFVYRHVYTDKLLHHQTSSLLSLCLLLSVYLQSDTQLQARAHAHSPRSQLPENSLSCPPFTPRLPLDSPTRRDTGVVDPQTQAPQGQSKISCSEACPITDMVAQW